MWQVIFIERITVVDEPVDVVIHSTKEKGQRHNDDVAPDHFRTIESFAEFFH